LAVVVVEDKEEEEVVVLIYPYGVLIVSGDYFIKKEKTRW
jgi:hypothetical protein